MKEKSANVFWNLVFFFDIGGLIAIGLWVWLRWPNTVSQVIHVIDNTCSGLAIISVCCILPLLLSLSYLIRPRRGAEIKSIHYEDDLTGM